MRYDPNRDVAGKYILKKTGGFSATMLDVIKAVDNQGIFMIQVLDGIEATKVDHQGIGLGVKVSEALVFAGLGPVANDLLYPR